MSERSARGFSILEMVTVIAIIMIAIGISFMALQPALKDARVTNSFSAVLTQLRQARQKSISERKRYIVVFVAPRTIELWRWDVGVPASPPAVRVGSVDMAQDIQFRTETGIPTGPTLVPDGFGSGTVAIDFDQGVGLGVPNEVMFMPDGSAHDRLGNTNNGVLYIARLGELYTSRAITVFGSTGRIRGWRLVDQAATPTWIQE